MGAESAGGENGAAAVASPLSEDVCAGAERRDGVDVNMAPVIILYLPH